MELDKQITVRKVTHSAKAMPDGNFAKVLVYEFSVGTHGPFREEFFVNEQHTEAINHRLNMHAALLRSTGALPPEGA